MNNINMSLVLPAEVLARVFRELPSRDLGSVVQVCSWWKEVASIHLVQVQLAGGPVMTVHKDVVRQSSVMMDLQYGVKEPISLPTTPGLEVLQTAFKWMDNHRGEACRGKEREDAMLFESLSERSLGDLMLTAHVLDIKGLKTEAAKAYWARREERWREAERKRRSQPKTQTRIYLNSYLYYTEYQMA